MLECEEIDTIFAVSEQKVTKNLIRKKIVQKNAYWGKIPDGEKFPLGSGTRIKGFRLGRIGVPNCTGWRPVEDELCSTNACDFEPDVIQHGHDDYFFSLAQKDLRTDWLCIDSLALREMPEEEVMHLEEGLQDATRYVHEEYRRSRFLLFGRNKHVAVVGLDDDTGLPLESTNECDAEIRDNAYLFEVRDNGEMDECHVVVCVDPSQINRIGEMSLDMLDDAAENLEYKDSSFLDTTGLFDVLLADRKMAQKLAFSEATELGGTDSGMWDLKDLRKNFGTQKVARDMFSLRHDFHAMRFYPDTDHNATLEAFNQNNPNTWPRFERVFPYVAVDADVAGVKFVVNKDYLKAPFGISTIMSTRVMSVMSFPNVQKVAGAAKVGGFGYEGTAQWQNPDWPCNVNRDKGFWKLRFRLAAKQQHDDEGYSWFHRIDRRLALVGNPCPLPADPCVEEVSAYCFKGFGVDSGHGENRAIDESI